MCFAALQPRSLCLNSVLADSQLAEDKSSLLRLVSLLRSVVRVKGLEAQAAEEELRELQDRYDSTTANVGTSERDLLDQVEMLCVCVHYLFMHTHTHIHTCTYITGGPVGERSPPA